MRHMTVTRELRGESLLAKTVNDQLARLERLMVETITGLAKLEQEKSRPVRRTGNGDARPAPMGDLFNMISSLEVGNIFRIVDEGVARTRQDRRRAEGDARANR